jgi:putative spermidine/putrescine transport system substrate-binding protein
LRSYTGSAGRRRPRGAATAVTTVVTGLLLALTGCTGPASPEKTVVPMAKSVGKGEGALNLVAWGDYAENGSTDPRVDWVQPFERRTGCRVALKYAGSAQQMAELMSAPGRRYDGVSAPPEVAWQLMKERQVAPVNPKLVQEFDSIDSRLRQPLKSGKQYFGVPFTWGANLLMYDPKVVRAASWGALFDSAQAKRFAGRVVVRDSALTLADAALYLREKDRSLDIEDPFELSQKQLRAATALLSKQRAYVKTYWNHPADAVTAFAGEGAVVGQVWPYHLDVLGRAGRSVAALPPGGAVTGWVDSWMLGARGENTNCMYQWLNWVTSPDIQQSVAEWAGVAPANSKACEGDRLRPQFCDAYHVRDGEFLDNVEFAHPPPATCSTVRCTTFTEWEQAWQRARN